MIKRVLFLMSDTGGGHRAAAEAIRDALISQYGADQVRVQLVDVFRHTNFPLNHMPEFYPWIVNNGKISWGLGFNLSNTASRATVLSGGMYLTNGRRLRRMVERNPADVVVCVHSVITRPSMQAYLDLEERPPFVTVVTDLVSTHMFWYDRNAEMTLVPTDVAHERGLQCGLPADRLKVMGLPVHPRFTSGLMSKDEARETLGLRADLPVILMVAGGEGMGPLYETARAVNDKALNCQLVIIAGKNRQLKERLDASDWNQPTHIHGFVTNMPTMMAAADVLITKAGPATISEACIAGLPMILNDAIPGQETGNVQYVVENNAGVYAPSPARVADAAESWLAEGPEGLARRSMNARRIARPDAVWQIAREVWKYAHEPRIANRGHRRNFLHDLLEGPRGIFPTLT